MRRALWYRLVKGDDGKGRTEPVYFDGPWWAFAVHEAGSRVMRIGFRLMEWGQHHATEECSGTDGCDCRRHRRARFVKEEA